MRSRPRATQAGQLFFLFLSPDGKVFHSRKKVLDHMEKLGGYTQFDFDKVREGAKNPRRFNGDNKRKHQELLDDEDSRDNFKNKNDDSLEEEYIPSSGAHDENDNQSKTKRSKGGLSFKQYF